MIVERVKWQNTKEDYSFNWDQKEVVARECCRIYRKMKETIYSLKNLNHINKVTYTCSEIWLPKFMLASSVKF